MIEITVTIFSIIITIVGIVFSIKSQKNNKTRNTDIKPNNEITTNAKVVQKAGNNAYYIDKSTKITRK